MRLAVVVNLVFLGVFKYYGFFVDSFTVGPSAASASTSAPVLEIALPIGISFFTFHAISYVVDVSGRSRRAQHAWSTS